MTDTSTIYERGWIVRIRRPIKRLIGQTVVLIHGWTGDEYSMDLFSRDLPENSLLLFPRGPFHAPGGYGWAPEAAGTFPSMQVFEPTCRKLMTEIEIRLSELKLENDKLSLVGFSQGGAVVYSLTTLYPERIERAAVLAGFFPDFETEINLSSLKEKPFFIAHGTEDDTIPVRYARQGFEKLKHAGAAVEYCEAEVGHKLAASCLKRLTEFLSQA